jgi:hypothetical protein
VVGERPNLQYSKGSSTEKEDHGMDIQNTEADIHLSPLMSFNAARDNEEYLPPTTLVFKV